MSRVLRGRTYLRPYRGPLAVAAALAVSGSLLSLARPWPLKLVVDHALGGRPLPRGVSGLEGLSPGAMAAVAAFASLVLVAAGGLIGYLTNYLAGASAERVGADLRTAVLDRLMTLSLRFHDRNRSGELVSRLTGDVSRLQDALVAWLTVLVPEALTLAAMLVVVVLLDPALALAGLAVTPFLAGLVAVRRRQVRAAQRVARERDGRLAAFATDVLRNVRAVQAFGREEHVRAGFGDHNRAAAGAALEALDRQVRYGPLADLVLAAGTGLVLWLGTLRVASGGLTLGELLVVLSYLGALYGPIRSLSRLATTLARGQASRERLAEVLGNEELVAEAPDAVPAGPLRRELALRDVSFAYRPGCPVLHNVHCTVAAGTLACVVGPTGAGKTTLLNLLLRLYEPDAGSIELDGVDLRRLALASLRDQIAFVPQDPWILDGTIADNIGFGRPGASRDEVLQAAHAALVTEFTDRLPDGLDTPVGEGGALLSGGQRRRLALARALLRPASLLLLDEPTSGLDAKSERDVIAALQAVARSRTTLIVTHHLALARLADVVLVLDGGRLVEVGPPSALVAADGPFARLWRAQHPLPPPGEAEPGKEVIPCLTADGTRPDSACRG